MGKGIVWLLTVAMAVGLAACKTAPEQAPTAMTSAESASTQATAVPTVETSAPAQIPSTRTEETTADVTGETAATTEETAAPTAVPTEATATAQTDAPTTEQTQAPTEESHSEFYAAGVSVDEIVARFHKVVLNVDKTSGAGDTALVQKWDQPVCYRIEGIPSQRDAQIFHDLERQLNAVEGFPGIQSAKGLEQNVTVYFLNDEEFETQFAHIMNGEPEDGIVQIWYNDSNGMDSGRVGYRKDAQQMVRDGVIAEKLAKLLGIDEVVLQEKEATNPKDLPTVELSAVDWAVIKLLYNPRIHSGMNADECEMIIRELYY